MIKTPRLWTREEEKKLIQNLQEYNGDMTKVSNEHGRSVRAIDIRTTKIMQELHITDSISVGDIYKLFGGVFSESQIQKRLNTDMTSLSSKNEPTLKSIEDRLDAMTKKLVKIEKLLKKKISK